MGEPQALSRGLLLGDELAFDPVIAKTTWQIDRCGCSLCNVDNRLGPVSTCSISGIILCMRPANERRRYIVTSSLIGWAHTQNDPCDIKNPYTGKTVFLYWDCSLEIKACLDSWCNLCRHRMLSSWQPPVPPCSDDKHRSNIRVSVFTDFSSCWTC